jgi:myo-inositol-1(or 4)-monophosphatase
VSIACEDADGALVGVVHQPLGGETFTAMRGGGAFRDGVRLAVNRPESLARALVATGFSYEPARRALQGEIAARLLPRVRDLRRGGSAALDLAWVAAGRLDAYYERGINLWDIAAGELICARAGLRVERLAPAGELPWGVLAAPASIADDLRALVA